VFRSVLNVVTFWAVGKERGCGREQNRAPGRAPWQEKHYKRLAQNGANSRY
jgi:hypothetical protein